MSISYTAYGLELRASFALPGMSPQGERQPQIHDAARPTVALEQVSETALLDAWSGPGELSRWSGVLGDGRSLEIDRGKDGDVLFRYGERADFRLDATGARLECAPRQSGLHWQQVLLCRILPNVAVAHGYEALHASAVESPRGVLAVAAPSGHGKSTLAVEFIRRGWRLFTDDVLILGRAGGDVRAHPGTPHLNIASRAVATIRREHVAEEWRLLPGERWVALRAGATRPGPVKLICLPERTSVGVQTSTRVSSTPLPLAPYMIGLAGDHERERERFTLYADLLESAGLVQLCCDRAMAPAAIADLIERSLEDERAGDEDNASAIRGIA